MFYSSTLVSLRLAGLKCRKSGVECVKIRFAFAALARGKLLHLATDDLPPSPVSIRPLFPLCDTAPLVRFDVRPRVIGDECPGDNAVSTLYADLRLPWRLKTTAAPRPVCRPPLRENGDGSSTPAAATPGCTCSLSVGSTLQQLAQRERRRERHSRSRSPLPRLHQREHHSRSRSPQPRLLQQE